MCSQQQHRFLYKAYKKSITAQYNHNDSTAQLHLYLKSIYYLAKGIALPSSKALYLTNASTK